VAYDVITNRQRIIAASCISYTCKYYKVRSHLVPLTPSAFSLHLSMAEQGLEKYDCLFAYEKVDLQFFKLCRTGRLQ
jgi:hypothetical protein